MKNYSVIADLIQSELDLDTISELSGADVEQIKLIKRNVEIEQDINACGYAKFMERVEFMKQQGKVAEIPSHLKFIKKQLDPLADAIADYGDKPQGRGRPSEIRAFFKRHDPHQLAMLTLRFAVRSQTNPDEAKITRMSYRLASSLEKELDEMIAIKCGWKLLSLLDKTSGGMFKITKEVAFGKTVYYLKTSDEFLAWAEQDTQSLAEMSKSFRPMVIPPKPWTGLHSGGFYDKSLQQPFIRNCRYANMTTHGPRAMPKVYEAVNKIQSTPFKINSFVLDVANTLLDDLDVNFKGFREVLPERPHSHRVKALWDKVRDLEHQLGITADVKREKGKEFGSWVREYLASIVDPEKLVIKAKLEETRTLLVKYQRWRKDVDSKSSKNRVVADALAVANEYKDEAALYFPCNLDWRGRIYPISAGLTTQGTGIQKALLKFAQGKPVGSTEALKWLKVHVANAYGCDKDSWLDRVKWTEENPELIKRVAQDPIGNLEDWIHSDEPWLFLAACEQMCKVYEHGLDAVVDIPIPMDGTCNGAQHYAAMMRDEHGAYGCNVAPNGTQGLRERIRKLREKLF